VKCKEIKNHVLGLLKNQTHHKVLLNLLKKLFFIEVKTGFAEGDKASHDYMAARYLAERRLTHPDAFPNRGQEAASI